MDTAFNERANVSFQLKGMKSKDVASYALKKMFQGKMIIIPGMTMKITHMGERFLPEKILLSCAYHFQKKKG